jgi:hypothetical protein
MVIIAQAHGFGLCNHNDTGRDSTPLRAEKIKSVEILSQKSLWPTMDYGQRDQAA